MGRTVDHEARRRTVVDRSMELFARMGYAKVSFLTISEATGVARTALYRYFKTKRDIFDAVIHENTHRIKTRGAEIVKGGGTAAERLVGVARLVIETLHARKPFLLAIFDYVITMVRTGEDMSGKVDRFTRGLREIFLLLLRQGKEAGEMPAVLDEKAAADVLFSLIEAVALRILLGTDAGGVAADVRQFEAAVRSVSARG